MEWNWNRLITGLLALLLLLVFLPRPARAASSKEIQKQIDALKQQRMELKDQIDQLHTNYEENQQGVLEIVSRKNQLDQEIDNLHRQTSNVQTQLEAYRVLIADSQETLDEAQTRYDTLNADSKSRIRAMEEDGSLSYWEVLFRANSFSNFLDRLNMIEEIAMSDRQRLVSLSLAYQNVCDAQETLKTEKAQMEQTQRELSDLQGELDQKRADTDEVIQELIAQGAEIRSLQEELNSEDTALLEEIAKTEKEYNAAKYREWKEYMETYTTVPPETTAPTEPSKPDNGGEKGNVTWLRPCAYRYLSSPFGLRKSPTTGASTYHQGVDLAAPKGTPIYATRAGIVSRAGYSASAGYLVTINHTDGYSSVYMHMTTYVVSVNTAVSAGQLIGYVGNTGITTGNHLHFGIAYNGCYINPCTLISF